MKLVVPQGEALGDLASRLQADTNGELRRDYCEMFANAQDVARRRLQEPQAAEDFEMNAALMEGAQLCDEIVSAVWHALHP